MMRKPILGLGLLAALCATARAAGDDWLPTLDKGLADAARSGQAVVYVTKWKPGV